jgi:hypothetical protein
LTRTGPLKLKLTKFEADFNPIEKDCPCLTCKTYTRAYLSRLIRQKETVGCHLISIHNIAYQMKLMRDIRNAIERDEFPEWIKGFMKAYFFEREHESSLDQNHVDGLEEIEGGDSSEKDPGKALKGGYPIWVLNALESVNIKLI